MIEDRDFLRLLIAASLAGGLTPQDAFENALCAQEIEKDYWRMYQEKLSLWDLANDQNDR